MNFLQKFVSFFDDNCVDVNNCVIVCYYSKWSYSLDLKE